MFTSRGGYGAVVALAALTWAGCSAGSGEGAGTGGTGGTGAGSGAGGAGAAAGSGGSAGSPGTVTLEFQVPSSKTYCLDSACYGPPSAITIESAEGEALKLDPGDCYMECRSCEMTPCPGAPCQQQGFAVTGQTMTWDGAIWQAGVCGANVACLSKAYAQSGSYTAVMCATPGTITKDASGVDQCIHTGPAECVEVPFEFPSLDPIVGKLPG